MITLKDIFSRTINKCNSQESLHPKKKLLKKLDLDIEDILKIKIDSKTKQW